MQVNFNLTELTTLRTLIQDHANSVSEVALRIMELGEESEVREYLGKLENLEVKLMRAEQDALDVEKAS